MVDGRQRRQRGVVDPVDGVDGGSEGEYSGGVDAGLAGGSRVPAPEGLLVVGVQVGEGQCGGCPGQEQDSERRVAQEPGLVLRSAALPDVVVHRGQGEQSPLFDGGQRRRRVVRTCRCRTVDVHRVRDRAGPALCRGPQRRLDLGVAQERVQGPAHGLVVGVHQPVDDVDQADEGAECAQPFQIIDLRGDRGEQGGAPAGDPVDEGADLLGGGVGEDLGQQCAPSRRDAPADRDDFGELFGAWLFRGVGTDAERGRPAGGEYALHPVGHRCAASVYSGVGQLSGRCSR